MGEDAGERWFLRARPDEIDPLETTIRRNLGSVPAQKRPRTDLTDFDRIFLPDGPFTAAQARYAGRLAQEWRDYGFTLGQTRKWLEAGLHETMAQVAAAARAQGLLQHRLGEAVTHPDTGERWTVLQVVIHCKGRPVELHDLLDGCKVERELQPDWNDPDGWLIPVQALRRRRQAPTPRRDAAI